MYRIQIYVVVLLYSSITAIVGSVALAWRCKNLLLDVKVNNQSGT